MSKGSQEYIGHWKKPLRRYVEAVVWGLTFRRFVLAVLWFAAPELRRRALAVTSISLIARAPPCKAPVQDEEPRWRCFALTIPM